MRSLLVRIFLFFWLIIGIATGLAALSGYYYAEKFHGAIEDFDYASTILEASAALESGGRAGLVRWLRQQPPTRELTIYIVDQTMSDILGRPVPPRLAKDLQRQKHLLQGNDISSGVPQNVRPAQPFSRLVSATGEVFTVDVSPSMTLPNYWLGRSRQAMLFISVLVVISGVIAYLLARANVRPIRKLREATVSVAEGNLDVRVEPLVGRRRDELGMLARDFDAMAEKLAHAATQQLELSRNISHELRSPLARMRVALDLARRQAGEMKEFDRINVEAERLDGLIGEILSYTRMDSVANFASARIEVVDVIEDVVENVNYEYRSSNVAGITVVAEYDARPSIQGFTAALTSAIENIVRNAARHSTPNGTVTVRLAEKDKNAIVDICDDGEGVDPAELARIFEPFYRTRTTKRQRHGTGLGLAIAERAVKLNRGTVIATNLEPSGFRVRIILPLI